MVMEYIKDLNPAASVIKSSISGESSKNCNWTLFKMKKN